MPTANIGVEILRASSFLRDSILESVQAKLLLSVAHLRFNRRNVSMHGGDIVADALKAQGVQFLFTLCGGHISPILVGCKERGIRVMDKRHEATAVFAADAMARLTGRPGVCRRHRWPGPHEYHHRRQECPNGPVAGGAHRRRCPDGTARPGALQDIDQLAIIKPLVKWATAVRHVRKCRPSPL